jgi:hypothetical protein
MFDPREAIAAHIDKSFTQAERGELIDGDAVEVLRQRRVERMKPRGRPPRFSHLVVSPRITAMLPTAWKGRSSRLAAPGAASSDGTRRRDITPLAVRCWTLQKLSDYVTVYWPDTAPCSTACAT